MRKWTKEDVLENARSKLKIYVRFKELAEQGEKQIQRLEKGNLNIDRIEGK